MALKHRTHDIEKTSTVQAKPQPQQEMERASNEHTRPTNPAVVFQRAANSRPAALRPADILTLQRTIGNRAVGRILGNQPNALPPQPSISANAIQLKTEEEEPLQAKLETNQRGENRTRLPDNLKAGIESLSGMTMDDVNVHLNSAKPAEVQALAFTQGTDIYIGPNEERHLPHEAWHVVQQKLGRVKPTMQLKPTVAINDDPALEKEADRMGMEAIQTRILKTATQTGKQFSSNPYDPHVVQARSKVEYHATQNYQYANPPAAGGALNATGRVATGVVANLDLTDPIHGSGVGAGIPANLMTDLGLNFPAQAWVQGHLLNSNLGGLGIPSNLFPITNTANSQHTWAVEQTLKDLLYNQPPAGNFALNNHGYLQYQAAVVPLAAVVSTQAPDADININYRTQVNQAMMAPAAPVWNPYQQFTVRSRAAGIPPVPAPWAPFGVGIGMPIGGGGVVNVGVWQVAILTNVANPNHAAMLAALGLAAAPAVPPGATFFLTQQAGAGLKIIGWQF